MKSSIRRFLFACALFLISGTTQAMSVTFVNPGKEGERFWDMVTETMRAAADDFEIDLEVVYAQRNRIRMAELGIEVTEREVPPDYLILVNEEQAAEKILVAASQKNIRTLMLLNDFLPKQHERIGEPGDNPNLLGAIIPDNFGAGQRMMTALLNCAQDQSSPQPYHFLAIGGDQTTPASIERNEGALSVLKAHSDTITLDRFLYANWNQQEAESLTDSYLSWAQRNNIKLSAIWSANDPIALGARKALKKGGLQPGKDVCMVGLNWSAEALKLVKREELLLSDGGHFLAGAWSMVLLHDYHNRIRNGFTGPVGHVHFQMQSITSDNVDRYLTYLGDENWGKIDFTRFALGDRSSHSDYDFSLKHVLNNISH
ncbi:ABC transporter substrate-binding protein [Pontibacterium sp. N1Y112]|uniref:ABC transporter substrate-binding protein n=1 Tax=Pontibacterium sinense TaxID=2781979 RepID=A0A8J7K067_9GAMM|nr:ABC transporter substrate-binding protein [Pontibacterium sinense]MBE9398624.1 ABC transporter substrate-binding protein [Pontibacterium sinense]